MSAEPEEQDPGLGPSPSAAQTSEVCETSEVLGEKDPRPSEISRFEEEAGQPQMGLAREFVSFLLHNKKWWLAPILVVLLLLGFLVFLAGTGAAPFIYTLF